MADNKIELKSISDLLGMNFFIPSYQRGYRWDRQQVKDLLDDIQEFIDKKREGFYCIQPLVVQKSIIKADTENFKKDLDGIKTNAASLLEIEKLVSKYTKWEVIDGQQRLTTIYILLSYLESERKYSVEYETRKNSKGFLDIIETKKSNDNIDYYHIVEAKEIIDFWFNTKDDNMKKIIRNTLLNKVQFIWYESIDEDPIKVFTRLNIGKISLTNAELIKALFLNKSNFQGDDYQKIRLQQQEIAIEWDAIEYTLQNDEFWLFLNEPNYDKPTRIDFIFDLICEKDSLGLRDILIKKDEKYKKTTGVDEPDKYKEELGIDDYKTFRYFYLWFKQEDRGNNIVISWKTVKTLFQIFQEWYNDLEYYHYVGYLIMQGIEITNILEHWNNGKNIFKNDYLIDKIKNEIINTKQSFLSSLNKGKNDQKIRAILVLHNIQSVIIQNSILEENEKYKLPVFYKFPFHLFKMETWDIEHIDSNTENTLKDVKEQKEWLKYSSVGITDENLKTDIRSFLNRASDDKENIEEINASFEDLHSRTIEYQTGENKLNKDEKQKIWNLTLLDSSTNRGYGNKIFPAKRRIIIGKDQGKKIIIDDNLDEKYDKDILIAFIPPCTMNVFLKYYNTSIRNLREWDRCDAKAYLENIVSALKDFWIKE
ncbi:hypothetical protein FACS1894147_05070 [Spirochaetia bacterium]|nr:hypothetical protein FACS1894147_05070 [Spirochaetia bacterium]